MSRRNPLGALVPCRHRYGRCSRPCGLVRLARRGARAQSNQEGHCCCCCCSRINSHNQVRGHRTGSSHSGAEEYPRERTQTNQVWYTHISQLTQFMPPPETYTKWNRESAQVHFFLFSFPCFLFLSCLFFLFFLFLPFLRFLFLLSSLFFPFSSYLFLLSYFQKQIDSRLSCVCA